MYRLSSLSSGSANSVITRMNFDEAMFDPMLELGFGSPDLCLNVRR